MEAHAIDARITVSNYNKSVIGLPRDCAPITLGTRKTNHDRQFCYKYDYMQNKGKGYWGVIG